MYKVIITDLDGTLLLPDSSISNYTKCIFNKLYKKNINLILATGRHYLDVKKIKNLLNINAYMITSNGARVFDKKNKLIYSFNLDKKIVNDLYKLVINNFFVDMHIYKNEKWYILNNANNKNYHKERSFIKFNYFNSKIIDDNTIHKIFFISNSVKELSLLEEVIIKKFENNVEISFSKSNCLEIVKGGVTKGKSLIKIIKKLNCSLNECIAFGDGMNDYDLLSIVGKGCIMNNSSLKLKEKLPNLEIIGNNSENSVSAYLEKIFL